MYLARQMLLPSLAPEDYTPIVATDALNVQNVVTTYVLNILLLYHAATSNPPSRLIHTDSEQLSERERRQKKEGRKRRVLNRLKDGAKTKSVRPATQFTRKSLAKTKDVIEFSTDLN